MSSHTSKKPPRARKSRLPFAVVETPLAQTQEPSAARPRSVVFAATDGTGGAPVAAAWFALLADPLRARAILASRAALSFLPVTVVAAMRELGQEPRFPPARPLTPELLAAADLVVTMGSTFERRFLGTDAVVRREHWLVPEIAGSGGPEVADLDDARNLRDLMRSRVAMLVFVEGWGRMDISRTAARVTRTRRPIEVTASF